MFLARYAGPILAILVAAALNVADQGLLGTGPILGGAMGRAGVSDGGTDKVRGRRIVGDRDCRDFSTQAEAQAFFKAAGRGDAHGLDRDRDGRACETLR